MVFMAFMLGFFVVSSQFWADLNERALGFLFGHSAETLAANWSVVALISIVLLLAIDFGYWLCHLAMHKSACLWEFHKVHHSAQVMTRATEFRQHPVELILFPNVTGFVMGLGHEGANYEPVANVFWLPFKNNWALLTRRTAAPALAAKSAAG